MTNLLSAQFVKTEQPTFKWHALLLNETCVKEQDANFRYDFRNDCASQRASNLLEFQKFICRRIASFRAPIGELSPLIYFGAIFFLADSVNIRCADTAWSFMGESPGTVWATRRPLDEIVLQMRAGGQIWGKMK